MSCISTVSLEVASSLDSKLLSNMRRIFTDTLLPQSANGKDGFGALLGLTIAIVVLSLVGRARGHPGKEVAG
jgi:hypothetical protein